MKSRFEVLVNPTKLGIVKKSLSWNLGIFSLLNKHKQDSYWTYSLKKRLFAFFFIRILTNIAPHFHIMKLQIVLQFTFNSSFRFWSFKVSWVCLAPSVCPIIVSTLHIKQQKENKLRKISYSKYMSGRGREYLECIWTSWEENSLSVVAASHW